MHERLRYPILSGDTRSIELVERTAQGEKTTFLKHPDLAIVVSDLCGDTHNRDTTAACTLLILLRD